MTEEETPAVASIVGTTISGYSIRRPARVEYKPQADITAHEVARLIPILHAFRHTSYPEDHIPADMMRHFEIWRPA